MAQIALAGGRLVSATEHLLRLAQLEPFDSHVHQMLIEVCLGAGAGRRRCGTTTPCGAPAPRLRRATGLRATSVAAGMALRQREPAGRRP